MKNHLKRIPSPRTWSIDRKRKFIVRPSPGAHPFEMGMALAVILRDKIGLASTVSEVKKLLNNKEILIDGKRRKDHRFIMGLFDVLSIPSLKKSYRLMLDYKGRIIVNEITEEDGKLKVCKITGKTVLQGGKIQYNLHDGKNLISDKTAGVGDSFLIAFPKNEIKEVLSLKPGAKVFLVKGKHGGDLGTLKEINGDEVVYDVDGKEVETAKGYVFVVGNKETAIKVRVDEKN